MNRCASVLASVLMVTLLAGFTEAQQTEEKIPWGPNLVKNGSFEQGHGAFYLTRRDLVSIDTDVVFRGLNAMKMQGEAATQQADHNIIVQGFALSLEPGTQVLYRIAYRMEKADAKHPARLQMIYKVKGDKKDIPIKVEKPLVIKKDCDWTVYEVVIKNLPADTSTFGFKIHLPRESGGTLWLDDIQVRTYKP